MESCAQSGVEHRTPTCNTLLAAGQPRMARVCRSSNACVQLVVVQGLPPQAMPEAPASIVQDQSNSKPNTTHSRPLAVRAALSCTGTVFAAAHQSYFLGSFSARMRSISSCVDERGSGAHACSPGTAAWVSAVLCATMLLARLCWLRRAADGGGAHRCDRLRAVSGVRKLEARPRRACISACCDALLRVCVVPDGASSAA